eukprot:6207141-Pleurochrysis_carterae.AAC.4
MSNVRCAVAPRPPDGRTGRLLGPCHFWPIPSFTKRSAIPAAIRSKQHDASTFLETAITDSTCLAQYGALHP